MHLSDKGLRTAKLKSDWCELWQILAQEMWLPVQAEVLASQPKTLPGRGAGSMNCSSAS